MGAMFHVSFFELYKEFLSVVFVKQNVKFHSSVNYFEALVWSHSFLLIKLIHICDTILTILRFFTFSNSRCKTEWTNGKYHHPENIFSCLILLSFHMQLQQEH